MVLAIFLVPLIYFLNAFFIGRLIKRKYLDINPFLASIVGFFVLFDLIYILSIWMYAGRAVIWAYFVVIGIIQMVLIGFYIANWRYVFITWSADWKKIVTFSVAFAATILIGWACFRNYDSEFGKNWIQTIEAMPHDIWKPIDFKVDSDNIITNFSVFNLMNVFWVNIFNIQNNSQVLKFCNWSWTIVAAACVACLATWIYAKEKTITRMILSLVLVLLYVVVTLAFIESYAVGDAWVLLLLLIYVLVMIRQREYHPIKLFILTTLLMGFLVVSCTSFYTVICLWIFSIYYVVRNKENSINYLLTLSWPLFLTIGSFLSIYSPWWFSAFNIIALVFILLFFIIYKRFGILSINTKIATNIYQHSGKIVYAALGLFVALILVANFSIFQVKYEWGAKPIDYKNFLTFTYTRIWSFNITSGWAIAIFNVIMYTGFISLAISYLVIRKLKKHKLNHLCKTDAAIKLEVIACVLFINPLFIHILKISTADFPLNTLDLNAYFIVPLFILSLKAIEYKNYLPITEWKYNWY